MTRSPSNCYLCGSDQVDDFFSLPPIPTMDGAMSESRAKALSTVKGAIHLRYCHHCSYIGNEGYEQEKVSFQEYDFSNAYSPSFAKHTLEIITRLVDTYGIRDRTVLDVGCGDGYFLHQLCQAGNNRGIGIDPGFDHSRFEKNGVDLTFIRDFYTSKYAELHPDLLTCRHVFSVIGDPIGLLSTITTTLHPEDGTIVYADAPNAYHTFESLAIWNVVYENRSWFSPSSLRYLFRRFGYDVLHTADCWNGEYIGIEAQLTSASVNTDPASTPVNQDQKLATLTKDFSVAYEKARAAYEQKINALRASGKRMIAWGAGARSVSFFNLFDISSMVPYIIDINQKRQGKFLPGTGQAIVAPEFLPTYKPDLILITNGTYAEEIKVQVRSYDLRPEFWVL